MSVIDLTSLVEVKKITVGKNPGGVEVDNEVIIQSSKKLAIGEFVNVKINKAFDYDLEGTVV